MILDASFLLDLKDGQQAAFAKAMELHDAAAIQRIAMPTVMEFHYGAAYTESEEEYRRVRDLLLISDCAGR